MKTFFKWYIIITIFTIIILGVGIMYYSLYEECFDNLSIGDCGMLIFSVLSISMLINIIRYFLYIIIRFFIK